MLATDVTDAVGSRLTGQRRCPWTACSLRSARFLLVRDVSTLITLSAKQFLREQYLVVANRVRDIACAFQKRSTGVEFAVSGADLEADYVADPRAQRPSGPSTTEPGGRCSPRAVLGVTRQSPSSLSLSHWRVKWLRKSAWLAFQSLSIRGHDHLSALHTDSEA